MLGNVRKIVSLLIRPLSPGPLPKGGGGGGGGGGT